MLHVSTDDQHFVWNFLGRLQASENLMSSNALSHPQPIYQPDPQFYEANNQTKNTPPSIGINQSGAEKGNSFLSHMLSAFRGPIAQSVVSLIADLVS